MKKFIFTCLMTIFVSNLYAQNESQTDYNFLRLPVSAHAAALGGENITIVDDDAMMMFSNPALIIGATPHTIALGYMNYMSGCNNANVVYNTIVNEKWHIGVGAQYMGYGTMKQTDAENNQLGDFSANDLALSGTLGYELADNLAGGITSRFVYSNIASYTSLAVAVDLGLNLYLPETDWSFSVVLKNLGGQIQAYNEDFGRMPTDLQLGITKRLVGSPLRLSATLVDMNHPKYKFVNHLCFGAELILSPQIYVAGGYNFRRASEMTINLSDDDVKTGGAGLSIGGGINLDRFKLNVSYAKYHLASSAIIANIAFII